MKKSYLNWTKSVLVSILLTLLVCSLFGCKKTDDQRLKQVIIYAYDSFSGEWGPGPEIARLFKEKTGMEVIFADCEDGGQVLSKAILEKKDPYADVVIGIDNNLWKQAYDEGILDSFVPSNANEVKAELWAKLNPLENIVTDADVKSSKVTLTPFDFSPFAFIFNTKSGIEAPKCLEDLTKDIYAKKIILMDPRTSTPGLGFETWVKTVYGDRADDYMKRLEPSILTMTPGWSAGYGMFTDGEAPLVISYTTSPAYHIEYGEGDQFQALIFDDGHIMQVEGAGIVKGAKNKKGAQAFIEFLISPEAQNVIPLTQWMFPVNSTIALPKSYDYAPVPENILN
ncbi:MAG: thiamine ABC transporter substrate-binding protein [Spirochaetia bacterium]|nr:thiamine ABC transporter substrate-binding protein [Spirochaetia bacterium]MDD7768427.1 thiamine ABC transporter substrate-binding protein [Treponema sp.]